ncbi:diaminobutyrate acetyltransferase [Methylohalobius crimeensis]|uniref:diaminobutyrate acetyltransferase n=1 Tax=Methylohalobius crimeensis TaxID=244365 RepID=UPI0003B31666|nr:diaminobutyrate acetyltransferase [Methylohalobius crimeensis]
MQGENERIVLRPPKVEDGTAIWRLVRDSGVLDLNSTYCYLLMCKHFADTCAVAEFNGEIVGFVTAYLPPDQQDTLFIWQIGIDASMRGRGLATRLLLELLKRDVCRDIQFVDATVGPSNQASRALFHSLAKRLNTDLSEHPYFEATLFPSTDHEPENLLHIGPFSLSQQNLK